MTSDKTRYVAVLCWKHIVNNIGDVRQIGIVYRAMDKQERSKSKSLLRDKTIFDARNND